MLAKAQRLSIEGDIQDTPSAGTHMLYPRPIEEQRGTGHDQEEQDPVSAFGPGPCDHQRELSPGGQSIWRGIVHTPKIHVAMIHAAALALPKTKMGRNNERLH